MTGEQNCLDINVPSSKAFPSSRIYDKKFGVSDEDRLLA